MMGNPPITERLRAVARADVDVPQPVLAEIAYGIARLPRSKRREALTERLEAIQHRKVLNHEYIHRAPSRNVREAARLGRTQAR
jgi:hypothetical protein